MISSVLNGPYTHINTHGFHIYFHCTVLWSWYNANHFKCHSARCDTSTCLECLMHLTVSICKFHLKRMKKRWPFIPKHTHSRCLQNHSQKLALRFPHRKTAQESVKAVTYNQYICFTGHRNWSVYRLNGHMCNTYNDTVCINIWSEISSMLTYSTYCILTTHLIGSGDQVIIIIRYYYYCYYISNLLKCVYPSQTPF